MGRRCAGHRGDVLATRSASAREETKHQTAHRRRPSRAARERRAAGADAPLQPLLRAGDRARRPVRALPRDRRPARLRRDRDALRRARDAAARSRGGASHRREPRGRIIGPAMTGLVRVAVAGDVTEAEEIQEILRSAGSTAELGDGEGRFRASFRCRSRPVEQAQDAIEAHDRARRSRWRALNRLQNAPYPAPRAGGLERAQAALTGGRTHACGDAEAPPRARRRLASTADK